MLIGKVITVKEAKNQSLTGKSGKVLDETRNTITIETHHQRFTLIKDQIITIEEKHG